MADPNDIPRAPPPLRRQTAYSVQRIPDHEEPPPRRRRMKPSRLIDTLLEEPEVQEFYYEDVPSDLSEGELSGSSDDEWREQARKDELEEDPYELLSGDDDLADFVVSGDESGSDYDYQDETELSVETVDTEETEDGDTEEIDFSDEE